MNIKKYAAWYKEKLLESISRQPLCYYDDSGIPSYLHRNKIISWIFWERIKTVFSLIKNLQGKTILDFGCGGCVLFKYLNAAEYDITGCENNFFELATTISSDLDKNIKIYKDINELKNKKFDVIFALDVLEHIEKIDDYLEIFAKITHRKSKIIISGPTETCFYKIGRYFTGFSGSYHKTNIYRIEKEMKRHNFKIANLKRLFFPFTLFRLSIWTPCANRPTNI